MDHPSKQTIKLCAILALVPLLVLYAQPDDPADTLVQVRDRLLRASEHLSKFSCIQTIDRSYYSRPTPPGKKLTCEQIGIDRQKARHKMRLDATDRIRVRVSMAGGSEVFSWVDRLKFESHGLEEVIATGPISTGAFGPLYISVFGDPDAHFQFLGEKAGNLEYGFRAGAEASHLAVKAGKQWIPTAESGSFLINPHLMELERFSGETSALAPETLMCDSSAAVDYRRAQLGNEDALMPQHAETRYVMTDANEEVNVSTYSSCAAERPSVDPPVKAASIMPKEYAIPLVLDDAIDTDTAAAGDVVSARLGKDVMARDSNRLLLREGTKVRGRILNVEHVQATDGGFSAVSLPPYFLIAISFDVAEVNGVESPLRLRLISREHGIEDTGCSSLPVGPRFCSSRWPENTLVFKSNQKHWVVPRGFESAWVTIR